MFPPHCVSVPGTATITATDPATAPGSRRSRGNGGDARVGRGSSWRSCSRLVRIPSEHVEVVQHAAHVRHPLVVLVMALVYVRRHRVEADADEHELGIEQRLTSTCSGSTS